MVERSPYFSLALGGWVPAVLMRDPATGLFSRIEGPKPFPTFAEADEASRFLSADG
jgi:hypothetical protein